MGYLNLFIVGQGAKSKRYRTTMSKRRERKMTRTYPGAHSPTVDYMPRPVRNHDAGPGLWRWIPYTLYSSICNGERAGAILTRGYKQHLCFGESGREEEMNRGSLILFVVGHLAESESYKDDDEQNTRTRTTIDLPRAVVHDHNEETVSASQDSSEKMESTFTRLFVVGHCGGGESKG